MLISIALQYRDPADGTARELVRGQVELEPIWSLLSPWPDERDALFIGRHRKEGHAQTLLGVGDCVLDSL